MNFWYWHKHDVYAALLTFAAMLAFFSIARRGRKGDHPVDHPRWASTGMAPRRRIDGPRQVSRPPRP